MRYSILKYFIVSLFITVFIFLSSVFVFAATLTSMSDLMSLQKASVESDHTIQFTTPSGVSAAETITITFPSGFDLTAIDYEDIDITDDGTDLSIAAVASGATWGAAVSGQVLTITSDTGTIAASSVVIIEIGTVATNQVTGVSQITNPSTIDSYGISIGGTFGDSGLITVILVADNQVVITATVVATPQNSGGSGGGVSGGSSPVFNNGGGGGSLKDKALERYYSYHTLVFRFIDLLNPFDGLSLKKENSSNDKIEKDVNGKSSSGKIVLKERKLEDNNLFTDIIEIFNDFKKPDNRTINLIGGQKITPIELPGYNVSKKPNPPPFLNGYIGKSLKDKRLYNFYLDKMEEKANYNSIEIQEVDSLSNLKEDNWRLFDDEVELLDQSLEKRVIFRVKSDDEQVDYFEIRKDNQENALQIKEKKKQIVSSLAFPNDDFINIGEDKPLMPLSMFITFSGIVALRAVFYIVFHI